MTSSTDSASAASSTFRDILGRVAGGEAVAPDVAQAAIKQVRDGNVAEAPAVAFLTALYMQGKIRSDPVELEAVLRDRAPDAAAMTPEFREMRGTGGDGLGTLNVSTAVAFVMAALGVPVVKHGNRALSSRSGATDVLLELGVPLPVDHGHIGGMVAEHRLAFLAATNHHPAMRHVGAVRRALGFRTIFNLLGPLCNPAGVTRQMVGVFSPDWLDPMVRTLQATGSARVWAISGDCGEGRFIDELTLAGPNHAVILEDGRVGSLIVDAGKAGLAPAPITAIAGGAPAHNADALRALAQGMRGAYRDTVLLNAAVALHVAGRGNNIIRGGDGAIDYAALQGNIHLAAEALDNGTVAAVLEAVRNFRADTPNRVTG